MTLIEWPNTSIMEALDIVSVSFYLARQRELSYGASGQVFQKNLADPIWKATMQSGSMYHDDAFAAQALINTMEDQLATFSVWNPAKPYPKYDPSGLKYLTSAPKVLAKGADNKRLSISGLVAGYTISRGDFLSIPSRACLLQVASSSVVAGPGGDTDLIEVTPFIRQAVATGDTVVLIRPYMNAIIAPGQDEKLISSDGDFSTIQFDVIQVP
jgi:hypothetical protein